ncbi:hypothetical protein [Streptomyces herbicida]|uniref:hypothetical protein n=1 Tax=Streptomyces herbicida TaxID=3065675 RepID=UPI0029309089|nr:hypothetical protein [Streptomyces sp. NEAU-HV9]
MHPLQRSGSPLICGNSSRTLGTPRRNLGDSDASGSDNERDWVKRTDCWERVERVLLTDGQVREYQLPPAEGKRDDPRRPGFARRYGFDLDRPVQREVEALEPAELERLVTEAVDGYIDREILAEVMAEEEQQRARLAALLGQQQDG